MKRYVFFILFLTFFYTGAEIYKIKVPANDTEAKKIVGTLDILSAGIRENVIFYAVNATPNEISQLPFYIEVKSIKMSLTDSPSYDTIEEIDSRIEQIAADSSGYSSVFTIGNSVEGRKIKAVRISAIEESTEETPEILFVGLHHAREWISYEVPLAIAEFFIEYADLNPVLNEIINSSVLWFIPLLNPDGYLFSYETDRLWRNNMRKHPDGTMGVDLNRNYDSSWIEFEYFHGTEPFSEPETRAIRDFIIDGEQYGVKTIDGLITYHSYGELILYPPGSNDEPPDNVELYQTVGTNMADLIYNECGKFYTTIQIKDLYPTFGEMTEWFMEVSGNKLSFTFELRPSFFESYGFELPPEYIKDSVKENIPSAVYFISHIITGETEINTDRNESGVFDAIENTMYDYEECYHPDKSGEEEEKEEEDDILPDEDFYPDEDSIFEDDPSTEAPGHKKSSGCSMNYLF